MSETIDADARAAAQSPVKGGLVTYLNVDGAMAAAKFYEKAFGAVIESAIPVDDQGRTMHVHLYVNGSSLMLSDFYPEHGHMKVAPQGFSLMIMCDDIDAQYAHAVAQGATGVQAPQDMFWGDRYAMLSDPFGVSWSMNQPQG